MIEFDFPPLFPYWFDYFTGMEFMWLLCILAYTKTHFHLCMGVYSKAIFSSWSRFKFLVRFFFFFCVKFIQNSWPTKLNSNTQNVKNCFRSWKCEWERKFWSSLRSISIGYKPQNEHLCVECLGDFFSSNKQKKMKEHSKKRVQTVMNEQFERLTRRRSRFIFYTNENIINYRWSPVNFNMWQGLKIPLHTHTQNAYVNFFLSKILREKPKITKITIISLRIHTVL